MGELLRKMTGLEKSIQNRSGRIKSTYSDVHFCCAFAAYTHTEAYTKSYCTKDVIKARRTLHFHLYVQIKLDIL